MKSKKIVFLGSGGHAQVLASILMRDNGSNRVGLKKIQYVDQSKRRNLDWDYLGTDAWLIDQDPTSWILVNGIGSVGDLEPRKKVFDRYRKAGFRFLSIIDPTALMLDSVLMGEGVQIMGGAILQVGTEIGDNSIVNSGAIIEHHSVIGSHTHVAPGTVVCGDVRIGDQVHLGAHSTVIQGVRIVNQVTLGAGSTAIHDLSSRGVWVGSPPKKIASRSAKKR